MKFIIDDILANEILSYLGQKPFLEVQLMIAKMQRLEAIKEGKKPEKVDKDKKVS